MRWEWNNCNMHSFCEWVTFMLCLWPTLSTMLVIIKLRWCLSAKDLTRITLDNNHTACVHICPHGIGCVCIKNYPLELMQPSSSKRPTVISAENQNGATIVKAIFLLCHYYIVWETTNAVEAGGQSWNESLKFRCNPGGLCSLFEWYKVKTSAALSSPRPWGRWLQLQPSCGFAHCKGHAPARYDNQGAKQFVL